MVHIESSLEIHCRSTTYGALPFLKSKEVIIRLKVISALKYLPTRGSHKGLELSSLSYLGFDVGLTLLVVLMASLFFGGVFTVVGSRHTNNCINC